MIETVLLTGGHSRRMGQDKAQMEVLGEPMLQRLLRLLSDYPTTILGPGGTDDQVPGSGPLAALSGFSPSSELIFVCSCDVPLFDHRLVHFLANRIGTFDASIPCIAGRMQPLCALYRSKTFDLLPLLIQAGDRRMFAWIDLLNIDQFDSDLLLEFGINPRSPLGANNPMAWSELVSELNA